MSAQVAVLQRTEPAEPADEAAALQPAPVTLGFRPEVFFLGRTEGAGVVRDPFGRIARRCNIVTHGQVNAARGALELDETFAYDDGEIDVWRWVMTAGRDGRYVVAEAKAGVALVAESRGEDYLMVFRRPFGRAAGALSPRYAAQFSLLTPDTMLKRATISLFGAPLGALSAVHRRVES